MSSLRGRRQDALWTAVLAAATISSLPARDVHACGGFFSETNSSEVATMSDIRVLLVRSGTTVEQYVQVAYGGAATSFAWIYPVQGNPQVSEAAASPFEALETVTRPRVTITTPSDEGGGGGFGCGGAADVAAGSKNGGEGLGPEVEVWQKGQVGAFDYVVLTATKADDLLRWLNDNGFSVPAETTGVINHYIAQKWYFVAMKVSVKSTNAAIPSTTVVKLRYQASELRYPLKMVSLSPAAETSVAIYLALEDQRSQLVPVAPFKAVTVDRDAVKATSSSTHTYEQAFDDAERRAGPKGMVLEYASTSYDAGALSFLPPASSLVRLRATFGPDEMDQDIRFETRPHIEVSSEYSVVFDPAQTAAAPPIALLALLAWGLLRRRG